MLESTKFSNNNNVAGAWWLENTYSNSSTDAFRVHGNNRNMSYMTVSNVGALGVRPAIEVSKTNIEY